MFLGKSRNHASNASLVYDPNENFISPQFHLVHDDEFHTVIRSNPNTLPPNWKENFIIDHYADAPSFDTPLKAIVSNKDTSVKIRLTMK